MVPQARDEATSYLADSIADGGVRLLGYVKIAQPARPGWRINEYHYPEMRATEEVAKGTQSQELRP